MYVIVGNDFDIEFSANIKDTQVIISDNHDDTTNIIIQQNI